MLKTKSNPNSYKCDENKYIKFVIITIYVCGGWVKGEKLKFEGDIFGIWNVWDFFELLKVEDIPKTDITW